MVFVTPMKKFALIIGVVAASATLAAVANAEIVEIGDTGKDLPAASCPYQSTCWVAPSVSGYQIQIDGQKNPFRVKKRGRIVAFTVQLGTVTDKESTFFNDKFGGDPAVRVAVLRPKPTKRNRYRYVLAGQSETFNVSKYLKGTPTFVVARTLKVLPGDVIGLTIPTWLPAFAKDLDDGTAWRTSRASTKCREDAAAAHTRRGTARVYGCFYRKERLIYTATIITDPVKTN